MYFFLLDRQSYEGFIRLQHSPILLSPTHTPHCSHWLSFFDSLNTISLCLQTDVNYLSFILILQMPKVTQHVSDTADI